MGVYLPCTRLPSAYQEVEYIQLTGTQYISSFRFPVNFRFTIKAAFDDTTTYYNVYDTQSVSPMLWVDTSGRFEMNINYKSSVFTKNTFLTVVSDATGSNNIVKIDGTQVISGSKISSITKDTFLLHRGASDGFKGKIAYMSLEDGNTKVFELIPCYRKSDSVIGMYDLVNDQFYTNSGTGTFTKGSDVNNYYEKELKNAYIGYVERTIMTMDDINQQSQFEATPAISSSLVTVSGSNPTIYSYGSSVRYWGGQTKNDITLPTKGILYLDCIFGNHNYSGQSWICMWSNNGGWIGIQQGSITDTTSNPIINCGATNIVSSVNFINNSRHTIKITWDNTTWNARVDNTQVLTNGQYSAISSSTKFRFSIEGGRVSNSGATIPKSIYDFYVKEIY